MHSWLLIAVMALTTIAIRFMPFILFRKQTPEPVLYLGSILPYCAMAMLVVYCLKDVDFTAAPFGLAELGCCAIVAALRIRKRNTLLSIGAGTVCYMLIVQFVI